MKRRTTIEISERAAQAEVFEDEFVA